MLSLKLSFETNVEENDGLNGLQYLEAMELEEKVILVRGSFANLMVSSDGTKGIDASNTNWGVEGGVVLMV